MTEDEILSDFPDLTRDDIRACLASRPIARAAPPADLTGAEQEDA
jgi:hypothetical protein